MTPWKEASRGMRYWKDAEAWEAHLALMDEHGFDKAYLSLRDEADEVAVAEGFVPLTTEEFQEWIDLVVAAPFMKKALESILTEFHDYEEMYDVLMECFEEGRTALAIANGERDVPND